MDVRILSQVLYLRATWRQRDGWDAARIAAHQEQALHRLRAATYAGSEFYRRRHAGLHDAPLTELPPVTKAELMENFDEAVTTPDLRLADLEAHLRFLTQSGGDPARPFRGRWRVAATAGTSGRRGIFVWNRSEWASVLASYARVNDWAAVATVPGKPVKMALVSSRVPTHQSAIVGASLASRFVPTLRLDVTAPIDETVSALNAFQPRVLVGYASALRPLAAEQREGRLHIAPAGVMSASEVLTAQAAAEMQDAWGSAPFDIYAATETAGIASPCVYRNRHVYEDLVIVEPVDRGGSPVPPGTTGAKLLVTVLFSRTLPLIRYEMSDTVRLDGRGCPCGRSFSLLEDIEGRMEDVLQLPGRKGSASIHPNVFHAALDDVATSGWQVIQDPSGLRVLVAGITPGHTTAGIRAAVAAALAGAGASPLPIDVQVVDRLERTALGKAPFVRALRPRA
ncbi:phenylacetate--CoA ligase family protein [Pseudarthrobacter enclensis]|uniref:Phenylacetate-coenzyme A ligase PaaK-like adenylate-forming protein n=1 Tax=Pseudarthrobacter enclensis TaxID=993070 RepID=A0ABT9RXD9_9MICC|nr:phenylacetate--CoA ligase family protein [Pseudarthrobacter enclensis]MDP9889910.1 phenylacetate-coenzyme A ligase PaaK-like adenylate-forming protein [Pseudarthrobacter enclensis]